MIGPGQAFTYTEGAQVIINLVQLVVFGVVIGSALTQMRSMVKALEKLTESFEKHVGDDAVHVDSKDVKIRLHELERRGPAQF